MTRWLDDAQASASLFIALIAGLFAVFQLHSIRTERRRRVLDTMVKQWENTKLARSALFAQVPPLQLNGNTAVAAAVQRRITELEPTVLEAAGDSANGAKVELDRLHRLRAEGELCARPSVGISFTSADDILRSEFKLRALLWAIERIRVEGRSGELRGAILAAETAVNQLNDFALDYEDGAYRPRTMLGQLHRSIAPVAAILEPIIWERSIRGRWGRRVLRLGLAAQHFNDVTRVHRSSDLRLTTTSGGERVSVVLHPAQTIDILGDEIVNTRVPEPYAVRSMWRLDARSRYWSAVSKPSLRPRYWFVSYGGLRLRRHLRQEDTLASCLRFVVRDPGDVGEQASTDFTWDLTSVQREMAEHARALRADAQSSSGVSAASNGAT